MKKTLLSFIAVWLSVVTAFASEYTFVFDGKGDQYGLTRMTAKPNATSEFAKTVTATEAGISFSIINNSETENGFALVNAGGNDAGLCVYSQSYGATRTSTPQITLTVPGGKITAVKFCLSGSGVSLISPEITFNETVVEQTTPDKALYYWDWSNSEGSETVVIEWTNSSYMRFIHTIDVTYTEDLGGKQECGLSFSEQSAEAIIGEEFTAPELSNPHNLPITWSSSDEEVATVDEDGTVTLVGGGNVKIYAATVGNDEYAHGNARYELSVIPAASNISELLEMAPAVNNLVKIKFPVTVAYAHNNEVFVIDGEGNAAHFHDTTNDASTGGAETRFKVGDVIPGEWIATNTNQYETTWEGILPDATEGNVKVVYPVVETINYVNDANKVVKIDNIPFAKVTPSGTSKVQVTAPDGTKYWVQNTYNLPEKPAGTYNLTVVVRYSSRGAAYCWLAPISYGDEGPEFPSEINVTTTCESVDVTSEYDEDSECIMVTLTGETAENNVPLSFNLPEGWDGVIGCQMSMGGMKKAPAAKIDEEEDSPWISIDDFKAQYDGAEILQGSEIEIPVTGMPYIGSFFLYAGDQVYVAEGFVILSQVQNPAPAIPNSFDVTVSCEGLNVTKEMKEEYGETTYNITIDGECDAEEVTVTLPVPEGWDGFYCVSTDGEVSMAKAPKKVDAPTEIIWYPISYAGYFGAEEGNAVTFPADGEEYQATFYLAKGDNFVYNFGVVVKVTVSQKEAGLAFPEKIDVTTTCESVDVTSEYDEDSECIMVTLTGETAENNVPLSFNLPEGWDGVIGCQMSMGGMKNAPAAKIDEDEDSPWISIDDFKAQYDGAEILQGSEIEIPVTGMPYIGSFFLYAGDQVYVAEGFVILSQVQNPAPAIPNSFDVTISCEGLNVAKEMKEEYGETSYYITIDGECDAEEVTVSLPVPEGWDGFYCASDDGEVSMAKAPKKVNAPTEITWYPISYAGSFFGAEEGNAVTFPADGEEYQATFYLAKGDNFVANFGVVVKVTVSQKEAETTPEFPAEITVTSDCETVEITQSEDEDNGGIIVMVSGETEEDNVTLTFDIPEGWDGIIGGMVSMGNLNKIAAEDEEEMPTWVDMAEFSEEMENAVVDGNKVTIPADGSQYMGQFMLYAGDKVYVAKGIMLAATIEKTAEPEPAPEFPETLDVTLSAEGLEMTQGDEQGVYTISVTGESEEDEVTITVAVPEGWDGFIGMTEDDIVPGDTNPLAKAAAEDDEDAWAPIEAMLQTGMKKTNTLTFAVDGEAHIGYLFLYKGENVYTRQIAVDVTVSKPEEEDPGTNGIDAIEAEDGDVRYFNIHGVEVTNPKAGIYVKVANGKTTKVVVK